MFSDEKEWKVEIGAESAFESKMLLDQLLVLMVSLTSTTPPDLHVQG